MYRSALRAAPRALRTPAVRPAIPSLPLRRFASTSTRKRSTWRSTAVRWGLAVGAVYWYNTSPMFMDELEQQNRLTPGQASTDDENLTVDAIIEEKRRQIAASRPPPPPPEKKDETAAVAAAEGEETGAESTSTAEPGSPEALEEEASQQGAFNPETGEINWDCPCLGGMAHGPCGEEFRSAFSCFVYSTEEPKGMDCIDKFQHMQDCFKKYPEVYAAELAEDEDDEESPRETEGMAAKSAEDKPVPPKREEKPASPKTEESASTDKPHADADTPVPSAKKIHATSKPAANGNGTWQKLKDDKEWVQGEVPTTAYDATTANEKKEN